MSAYERLLRPILFRMDPERVHNVALWAIARGLIRGKLLVDPRLERTVAGIRFPNPLGLAAGFDKNGVALDRWKDMGFGFAEAGTATWLAQPGNPKPRLFRLPEDRAVINRFGFNNSGAAELANRLRAAQPGIPIGINIGKSKAAPLEQAIQDYEQSFSALKHLGDYFVVNVSSPNTPGLRTLQEKGPLTELLSTLRKLDGNTPLFVKVSPDLSNEDLLDVVEVAKTCRFTGIVATNTTLSRDGLSTSIVQDGGLSGKPLFARSNECLRILSEASQGELILIGVGGVFSGDDLRGKLELGASLVQIYTGWVYGGPKSAARILLEFLAGES